MTRRTAHGLRSSLVSIQAAVFLLQVAVCGALLVAASLLALHLLPLQREGPGLDAEHQAARMTYPPGRDGDQQTEPPTLGQAAPDELRLLPGIAEAGAPPFSEIAPLDSVEGDGTQTARVSLPQAGASPPDGEPGRVSETYLPSLDNPGIGGRSSLCSRLVELMDGLLESSINLRMTEAVEQHVRDHRDRARKHLNAGDEPRCVEIIDRALAVRLREP